MTEPDPPEAYTLVAAERWQIERALVKTRGNKRAACRLLGIGKSTLYRKLDQYGIEVPRGWVREELARG